MARLWFHHPLQDGAGRLGKMLFARRGKKFDCDLKQMRFLSSMLMEVGAAMELCTVVAPTFFLPMACAANVFKVSPSCFRAGCAVACAHPSHMGWFLWMVLGCLAELFVPSAIVFFYPVLSLCWHQR